MIAVSRQRRQPRTTHKRQNTRKAAARQSQISTSLPLQDADVLQSQLLSAHTHTPQTGCKRTHTLAPTQSDNLAAALHNSTTTIVQNCCFRGGGSLFRARRRWISEERGRRRGNARARRKTLSPLYFHGIHLNGGSTLDERRTDTFNAELCGGGTPLRPRSAPSQGSGFTATEERRYSCLSSARGGMESRPTLGVCWSFLLSFFFKIWKWMQMREKLLLGERQKAQRS